jgi:hypothetical protein
MSVVVAVRGVPPATTFPKGSGDRLVKKLLRLGVTAVGVVLAIRLLDWLLTPTLPLLGTLLVAGFVLYAVVKTLGSP